MVFGLLPKPSNWIVTMRKVFAFFVLSIAILIGVAQFGPSALVGEPHSSDHGPAPEFTGTSTWLNSSPLTMAGLKGRVILVQFWTYSCVNCLRTLPYVTKWYEKYKDKGFIVIGVHTPEFAFERETGNVETAIKRFGISYPVAQDNQYRTWKAYENQYWPAEYLIDKSGKIVATQFGEGGYSQIENAIARLVGDSPPDGKDKDPDLSAIGSPEMYFGTEKNSGAIVSSQDSGAGERYYASPESVPLDRLALSGTWKLSGDNATLSADGGEVLLRFRAPKVNLVMGSQSPQTLSMTVDGEPQPPVTVQGSQLYSLFSGASGVHVLRLTIPKAGLSAFTFTFG
jgi:thiol-disulfide isomerase/thioredoxin